MANYIEIWYGQFQIQHIPHIYVFAAILVSFNLR